MSFCGLSSVAAAGRMLFAFSRDDGIPGSRWLKRVSHRYRTPANSLVAIAIVAWLFSVAAGVVGGGTAIVIVTAISTIFLYAAYGLCIYLGATTTEWLKERVWSLGRWSKPIAWRRVCLGRRADGPVLLAHVGQHLLAVHGRHVPRSCSSTTSPGHDAASRAPMSWVAKRSSPSSSVSSSTLPRSWAVPPQPERPIRQRVHLRGRPVPPVGPIGIHQRTRRPRAQRQEVDDERTTCRSQPGSRSSRASSVRDGQIDTLIVALTDMQGRLMGKRVQAQAFLDGVIDHGAHFCTYLLGTDMEMNTPDGFALMNWETGYGDWVADAGVGHPARAALAGEDGPRPGRHDRRGDAPGDPGVAAHDPQAPGRARPRNGAT